MVLTSDLHTPVCSDPPALMLGVVKDTIANVTHFHSDFILHYLELGFENEGPGTVKPGCFHCVCVRVCMCVCVGVSRTCREYPTAAVERTSGVHFKWFNIIGLFLAQNIAGPGLILIDKYCLLIFH